ncbi:PP2C family protein-serine/threonine phosphatase [Streptomyces parvulus]|nr:SpoIIE family protein phosphatase [Streptomyces parvulus]
MSPASAASGAGGGGEGAAHHRDLTVVTDLLAEQRRRITDFDGPGERPAAPVHNPGADPASLPEPGWQQTMDAIPMPALLVAPVLGRDGVPRDYWYVGRNQAALRYSETVIPKAALPAWSGRPVPLFGRFPEMAHTAMPRMLAEAYRGGEIQGPTVVEFPLRAPDGEVARVSAEVRVSRCGPHHLLVAWERGNRQALARAAQHLARTCWMEWNLTGQPPRASFGVRHVLGLHRDAPLPGLVDVAAMTDHAGAEALYQVLYDVLLRGRTAECDLRLPARRNGVLRLLAEPVFRPGGPVWAVRGVMMDVTGDRLTRHRARHAEREATRARDRAQAFGEVAAAFREALSPRFAGENVPSGLEAAAVYRPDEGAGVGGDWYKARVLPGGRTLLALGDARGHGLAAVTLMAKLRYALAGLAFTAHPVEHLTGWLSNVACDDGPESTATAIVGAYHPERRLLRWVSAGHPAPLLLRDDRVRPLSLPPAATGLPLGVVPDAAYTAVETVLVAGDVVLMYSDGLVERRGSDIDADTELLRHRAEQLARTSLRDGAGGLQAYAEHVVRAMSDSPQTDDATLLAVRCLP